MDIGKCDPIVDDKLKNRVQTTMIKYADNEDDDEQDKESQRTVRMKKLTESLEVNGPKAFRPCQGEGTPVRPFNPFKRSGQGE